MRERRSAALPAALAIALAACGPAEAPEHAATGSDGLTSYNGLANNGLANNGLANNGLANNGLTALGLLGTLGSTSFGTWFNQDPALADSVLRYVAKCALAPGTSVTWKNRTTGLTYTWTGELGLAPGWATSRRAPAAAETRTVTACLAALANKYGLTVPISLQGRSVTGAAIPLAAGELTTYSVQEGCFFGDVFDGTGVFVGLDHQSWDAQTTSARACALDVHLSGTNASCPPIYQVGFCRTYCRPDASGTSWASCTWNGATYPAITTRLRPEEVYRCGDGVCQFTERCGTSNGADSCASDCGACP